MSWSEDDFLERLMPALRRELGGGHGACPDAATVQSVIEGEASDWLRDAYAQHLPQCSECSELDTRLRNFDRPVLVKDEAEWKQTEKRLDNWLNAHLESRAVASRRAAEERASRPRFGSPTGDRVRRGRSRGRSAWWYCLPSAQACM